MSNVAQKRLRARGRNGEFNQPTGSRQAALLLRFENHGFYGLTTLSSTSPRSFSAEDIHFQGELAIFDPNEVKHVPPQKTPISRSARFPYKPAFRAARKVAKMARSKALAMRDYVKKPAEQPTKRITPEFVAESPEPEPEEEEPWEEPEVLRTLGTADNPVYWEPTCFSGKRNHFDDAALISTVCEHCDFENDFLLPLLQAPHSAAAYWELMPPIKASCDLLKEKIDSYLRFDNSPQQVLCTEALVFYRRHSPWLEPHLTQAEVDLLESMCMFVLCFLRNSGYHVTRSRGSSPQ